MSADLTGTASAAGTGGRPGLVRHLLRSPLAIGSILVILVAIVLAIAEEWLTPFPPNSVQIQLTNAPPFTTDYLLGGDKFGRDILSRLIAGSRGAMVGVLIVVSISVVLGVVTGLIAGYYGKLFDSLGSWGAAVLMAVPGIIVLIALYTLVDASMEVAMAVLGVLSSPSFFWLTRTLTRGVKSELYVDAARVSGLSDARIVGRHVLIAIRAPIIIMTSFLAGTALAVQAGLEFLGLSDRQRPSWGGMLTDAFANIYRAGWQLIWPGLALGLVMAAFVLVGNAVRDALQGTYVKPSRRARRRQIVQLLGDAAVTRTLGTRAAPMAAGSERQDSGRPGQEPLLVIEELRIAYPRETDSREVVHGVSVQVEAGQVVGLVGESGSGKTQTVFAALGVLPEEAIIAGGSVRLDGRELLGLRPAELVAVRGTAMGYVPQEPMSNLDPSFTVGAQLVHGIRAQRPEMGRRQARHLAMEMLARVGIHEPKRTFASYPHEISGGMAQRVLIAGAVACEPKLLIADEPTTALDVTVQAEILDLLRDLQRERQMGVLLVTHNFGVVADLCDRVVVMREGVVVEHGAVAKVFHDPQHEYTRMLLDAILDDVAPRSSVPRERRG
ncbi:MAG: dipeptide/oligopeptide/nickel ABC transporter permease/ATP-binding protein [Microbacteriaceae bacterium]|nr:dipeptide/oligopeptide/nickel ABC transporter permease/ATP-binding protein [Microbacteriaceae bacterium]